MELQFSSTRQVFSVLVRESGGEGAKTIERIAQLTYLNLLIGFRAQQHPSRGHIQNANGLLQKSFEKNEQRPFWARFPRHGAEVHQRR